MMKKAEDHLSIPQSWTAFGGSEVGAELESRMHNRMGSRMGMTQEVPWPKPGQS